MAALLYKSLGRYLESSETCSQSLKDFVSKREHKTKKQKNFRKA